MVFAHGTTTKPGCTDFSHDTRDELCGLLFNIAVGTRQDAVEHLVQVPLPI